MQLESRLDSCSQGIDSSPGCVPQSKQMQHGFSGGEQHNPDFTDPMSDEMLGLWLPRTQRAEPMKADAFVAEPLLMNYDE